MNDETMNGMLMRDYFAAKIMQSLVLEERFCGDFESDANTAYKAADAMLKARIKTDSGDAQRNEVGDRK